MKTETSSVIYPEEKNKKKMRKVLKKTTKSYVLSVIELINIDSLVRRYSSFESIFFRISRIADSIPDSDSFCKNVDVKDSFRIEVVF